MKKQRKNTPALLAARGAICSALCVVLLSLAAFLEVLDMTVALLASLVVFIGRKEEGNSFAVCIYLCSSVLSFILMPANSGTLLFALVFGWFPLLYTFTSLKIQKAAIARLVNSIVFVIAFMAAVLINFKVFVGEIELDSSILQAAQMLSLDTDALLLCLRAPFFLNIDRGQALMLLLYLLLSFPFGFLLHVFFEKFNLFYHFKIRPILKKIGVLK